MSADEAEVPQGLTPNQINALVVLMAEAREMTNNDLKEHAGFALTGGDNRKLVELGLVETDRSHRPFSHALTDRGWKVVRKLHTAPPSRQAGSATRSLLTLLANVDRSLDRLHISAGEFFKQAGEAVAGAQPREAIEARVRAVYAELAGEPGGWIGLADLRDRLAGVDRGAVDDALRAMVGHDGVRIIPVANTKSLTPRDRAAVLVIGDEDNHALAIGPS